MIEITQEGIGIIQMVQEIPKELRDHVIDAAIPHVVTGDGINALWQQFSGAGFSAWYSRYWTTKPVVLRARDNEPILELRIALKNSLRGEWDKIQHPELRAHYFQLAFVPHTITRAVFAPSAEWQTFDIHFTIDFLLSLGLEYRALDVFLRKAAGSAPAELSAVHHACSPVMMEAVHTILNNHYSITGKARLLRNQVENILLAALEISRPGKPIIVPLSIADIDALHHVRTLIELSCPVYPGNDVLIRKTNLNGFKLSDGFPRLFGMSPYTYFLQLRFELAKKLLRAGDAIGSVSDQLEYETPTIFIKAFRKRFGMTPKQWQRGQ